MFIRLSDSAREMLKARAIAVGPRGGRYYVGSERKDAKGRKVRSYVGNEVPHESRWAPEVRASHDARDARLPPEGHALTRHWKGKEVRAAGGRWDPDRKVWTLRNSGISTKFLRGLQRAGVNIEVIKSLFLRLPKARR